MAAKTKKRANLSRMKDYNHAVVRKSSLDLGFLTVVILLAVFGLIMVFSASYPSANYRYGDGLYFFRKQGIWVLLGFVGMLFTIKYDYRKYKKNAFVIAIVTLAFLGLVLLSPAINGARRWLGFGGFSFQPSEMAKISVIIYFAAALSVAKEKIREYKCLLKFFGMLGVVLVLLFLEPHFSVCIIIGSVVAIMLLVAGAKGKHFLYTALPLVPVGVALMIKESYRLDRLKVYLDPFIDPKGDGWQIIQSLYAIGSGGLFGLGFGNSRQKYMYVSEPQNDFIFSIICEELGIIGAVLVIVLFAILIWRGLKIAINAPDTFGTLLVTGIISLVAVQTFLNIAVVTKLIPTTGIPLPFFSAGGSSLVFLMMSMGMVLNVSTYKTQVVDLQ